MVKYNPNFIFLCTKNILNFDGKDIAKINANMGNFLSPIMEGKLNDINIMA